MNAHAAAASATLADVVTTCAFRWTANRLHPGHRAVFVAEEKMAAAAAGNRKSGLLEKVSKSVNGFS